MARQRSTSTSKDRVSGSETLLIGSLLLAGIGAALLLVNVLGTFGTVAGLVAIVAGTVLSAPYSERAGAMPGWWTMLAAGALIALAGAPVGLAVETLGGLMTVLGGALVAIAVALGIPGRAGAGP